RANSSRPGVKPEVSHFSPNVFSIEKTKSAAYLLRSPKEAEHRIGELGHATDDENTGDEHHSGRDYSHACDPETVLVDFPRVHLNHRSEERRVGKGSNIRGPKMIRKYEKL